MVVASGKVGAAALAPAPRSDAERQDMLASEAAGKHAREGRRPGADETMASDRGAERPRARRRPEARMSLKNRKEME